MPYPPIYIINLKRTPERKLFIQRQLDALNLGYEFVEAIDKYDLGSKTEREIIADQLSIDITNMEVLYGYFSNSNLLGNLACLLSHVKVYNLIIKNNIPYACVLEDDVYLLPVFPKTLITAQKISWEVLMLSSKSAYIRKIIVELHTSKLRSLYKLMYYKRYYPELTFYTVCLIVLKIIKLFMLRYKLINKISAKARYIRSEQFIEYMVCELGAVPNQDRSSWHKVTLRHHITTLEVPRIASGMAYMLTRSAAVKWKQTAISGFMPIDVVPMDLYSKGNLDLHLVTLPCVKASYQYLVNSAHCD